MAKITKKKVNELGGEYLRTKIRDGERNLTTERAFIRYMDAKKEYEQQQSKKTGTFAKKIKRKGSSQIIRKLFG